MGDDHRSEHHPAHSSNGNKADSRRLAAPPMSLPYLHGPRGWQPEMAKWSGTCVDLVSFRLIALAALLDGSGRLVGSLHDAD
jgi:hypothetical protein